MQQQQQMQAELLLPTSVSMPPNPAARIELLHGTYGGGTVQVMPGLLPVAGLRVHHDPVRFE